MKETFNYEVKDYLLKFFDSLPDFLNLPRIRLLLFSCLIVGCLILYNNEIFFGDSNDRDLDILLEGN